MTPATWPRIALCAGWLFVLGLGAYEAVWTYAHTPDVENFRAFAEPGAGRAEGKLSYLFSPLAIMVFFVGIGLWRVWRVGTSDELARLRDGMILTVFILLAGAGLWVNCHRAARRRPGAP